MCVCVCVCVCVYIRYNIPIWYGRQPAYKHLLYLRNRLFTHLVVSLYILIQLYIILPIYIYIDLVFVYLLLFLAFGYSASWAKSKFSLRDFELLPLPVMINFKFSSDFFLLLRFHPKNPRHSFSSFSVGCHAPPQGQAQQGRIQDFDIGGGTQTIMARTPITSAKQEVPYTACRASKCANASKCATTANVQTWRQQMCKRQQICKHDASKCANLKKIHQQQMCKRGDSKCAIFHFNHKCTNKRFQK